MSNLCLSIVDLLVRLKRSDLYLLGQLIIFSDHLFNLLLKLIVALLQHSVSIFLCL